MKVSKDFMFEVIEDSSDEALLIYDKITGKSRWSDIHELVFKWHDKYWIANYQCGSTESQDEGPWEYDNEVEIHEAEPVEKITIVYKKVS